MLFVNTKSDIGNRYRKNTIGKYRDRIGSNMKISESDRELKNKIGTSLPQTVDYFKKGLKTRDRHE